MESIDLGRAPIYFFDDTAFTKGWSVCTGCLNSTKGLVVFHLPTLAF